MLASVLSGLYPNVAKVLRPHARFTETMGGNHERKSELKEFQFYVRTFSAQMNISGSEDDNSATASVLGTCVNGLQRVFLFPGSIVSQNSDFSSK